MIEDLFEYILDLFINDSVDLVNDDKINKVLRYVAGISLILACVLVLEFLIVISIKIFNTARFFSIIFLLLFVYCLINSIKSGIKVYREYKKVRK